MKQIVFLFFIFQFSALGQNGKNHSVISVEKANIVYRGITNPIKIAVPGAKFFKVEAYGKLTKLDSIGNYNWDVTSVMGTKGLIKIDAVLNNDSLIHEEKEFKIRVIPPIEGHIKTPYLSRTFEMSKDQLINIEIESVINNFNYYNDSIDTCVDDFELIIPDNEPILIEGNKMNEKAKLKIASLSLGTVIYIKNISMCNSKGFCLLRLPTLKIKLSGISEQETICPTPIVSFKHRDVVYRGIENQLEIAVPGAKSFTATAPGLIKNSNGSYRWNVNKIETNSTNINFEVTNHNDSVFSIKKRFYIKKIKPIIATLNDRGCQNCIIEISKADIKEAKIGIKIEDFIDSQLLYFNIHGFTLELPEGYLYKVGSDIFSYSAQKMILQYPSGTIFNVTDIIFTAEGYFSKVPTLKFMIVDKY